MKYLQSSIGVFHSYKQLAEKAMVQIADTDLVWQPNEESNSIITIVKHMYGNMLSRWTDFLTTDGEKPWRQRDAEFENETLTRAAMLEKWEEGWKCVFDALNSLTETDLDKTVMIRNEPHSVVEAINRQIAHYAYHVGQIVYIAKLVNKQDWHSLTIPRNKSKEYNAEKFGDGRK